MRRLSATFGILVALAAQSAAQDLRGVVRDSASKIPIPGAVVITLGPDARVFARTVTDEKGAFTIPRNQSASVVRFLRFGFRPHDVAIARDAGQSLTMDVGMSLLPTLLDKVTAVANASCPRRGDADVAFGFWEQT